MNDRLQVAVSPIVDTGISGSARIVIEAEYLRGDVICYHVFRQNQHGGEVTKPEQFNREFRLSGRALEIVGQEGYGSQRGMDQKQLLKDAFSWFTLEAFNLHHCFVPACPNVAQDHALFADR